MILEKLLMKYKTSCRIKVLYRAKLDEASPCEASDIGDARKGTYKNIQQRNLKTFPYWMSYLCLSSEYIEKKDYIQPW